MTDDAIDYGPLAALVGAWQGDRGMDIAPEPDGTEQNPYYETLTFEAIGDVDNAEQQTLAVLHYVQIVRRKSNDEVFHHETGYWMYDAATSDVMHSLAIPRAVVLLAGGSATVADGVTTINVEAEADSFDWSVAQSPFMRDNAKTLGFKQTLVVDGDTLNFSETTFLDIYGRKFDHTDNNVLTRVG